MKLKVVLLAGVIGFSAQVSNAATDNSCNPFLFRGCSGSTTAVQYAAPHAAVSNLFAALRKQSAATAPRQRGRANGLGRMFSRLMRANGIRAFNPRDNVELDSPVAIVAVDVEDERPGGGVSVVPVPAAGFLLLAGLGGLVMIRRKKS